MFDSESVFEMAIPQSQIKSLSEFLSHAQEVVIIRLKHRPPFFVEQLQSVLKKRLGVPYSFDVLHSMMPKIIMMRFFRIIKPRWSKDSGHTMKLILKG